MTLEEIRWMSVLFKTNNMSKAAEELYISQPALSQCLQRVEKQLGFRIFERSNKGLVPTKKGELFQKTASEMSDLYRNFLAQASLLDESSIRFIRIAMPPYFSMMCSADVLAELSQAHPEISFSIIESYTSDMEKLIKNGEVQIIVTKEPLMIEGLVAHPFGSTPEAIFLRKGSPAKKYAFKKNGVQYLDPMYLVGEPMALTREGQSTRKAAELILEEADVTPHIIQETRHIINLYRYASEGISSSISPCTSDVLKLDNDDQLIYYIPDTYRYSNIRSLVCLTPELDRLVPSDIVDIIQDIIGKILTKLNIKA